MDIPTKVRKTGGSIMLVMRDAPPKEMAALAPEAHKLLELVPVPCLDRLYSAITAFCGTALEAPASEAPGRNYCNHDRSRFGLIWG